MTLKPAMLAYSLEKIFSLLFASPNFNRDVFWEWMAPQVPVDELTMYKDQQFESVFILWESQFRQGIAAKMACEYPELEVNDIFFKVVALLCRPDQVYTTQYEILGTMRRV
jgi:hypothetical protein